MIPAMLGSAVALALLVLRGRMSLREMETSIGMRRDG